MAQPLEAWGTVRARAIVSIIAHDSYHTCEIISLRHNAGLVGGGDAFNLSV